MTRLDAIRARPHQAGIDDKVRRVRSAASNLFGWYRQPIEASLVLDVMDYLEDLEAALARLEEDE